METTGAGVTNSTPRCTTHEQSNSTLPAWWHHSMCTYVIQLHRTREDPLSKLQSGLSESLEQIQTAYLS